MTTKLEVLARISAKEKYSGGKGKTMKFATNACPDFAIRSIDGKRFLMLKGSVSEYTEKTWNDIPYPTYDRKIELRLGFESCKSLIRTLETAGLIHIQVESKT